MAGAFATIFSLEKSRKWIMREGLNGISLQRLGSADRQWFEEVAGVLHGGSPFGHPKAIADAATSRCLAAPAAFGVASSVPHNIFRSEIR